jgi:hypothetical protein
MAQNPANIHIGAARIFLAVSPPNTGNPPQLLPHSDGTPLTGVEVGYTQDAATFTYKQNKQEVEAEQSLNPVDVFVVNEEIQIEFNAMEHVYLSLKTAFDNVGSVDDAQKTMFYGGDSGGLVSVTTQCVALTSRIRTAAGKHEVLVLYRVYNMEGVSIPYNRTGVALYKITLKGLVDTSRMAGDRLFQWFREKGAVLATGATSGAPGTFTPPGSGVPNNLGAMGPVLASPLTTWVTGAHVIVGDTSKVHWNGGAWASGESTGLPTGATAGTPGVFTPAGRLTPYNLAAMTGITANPATAWTTGQHMVLGDGSKAFWNGTTWAAGTSSGTFRLGKAVSMEDASKPPTVAGEGEENGENGKPKAGNGKGEAEAKPETKPAEEPKKPDEPKK